MSGEEEDAVATRMRSVTRVFVGCSNSNETPASQQKIEKVSCQSRARWKVLRKREMKTQMD